MKYDTISSYMLKDNEVIKNILNIMHSIFEDNTLKGDDLIHKLTLLNIKDAIQDMSKGKFYTPEQVLALDILVCNKGLKFIVLQTHASIFPFLILYNQGQYQIVTVFSLDDITSEANKIDSYAAHIYHMEELIDKIMPLINV